MSRPEPRPALQRSDDGVLHPAAPRAAPEQHVHPVPHAPASATLTSADSKEAGQPTSADTGPAASSFSGKAVTLSVEIPKDLRKAVRRLAGRRSESVDAVVAEALARHVTAR